MTVSEKIASHLQRYRNAADTIRSWLERIGVEVADTDRIDDMAAMVDAVELGGSEFPDITNANYLFYGGARWEARDILIPAAKKAKQAVYMLANFPDTITDFDLTEFDFSCVENANHMFYFFKTLTSVEGLSMPACVNADYLFNYCTGLEVADLSNVFGENEVSMNYLLQNSSVKTVKLSGKASAVTALCYGCEQLESIDFAGLDTSACTAASTMLRGCIALKKVDLTPLDFSAVTTCSQLFYGDVNLEEIIGFSAPIANISSAFPSGSASSPAALRRLVFEAIDKSVSKNFSVKYCSFERSGAVEMFSSLPDVFGGDSSVTITMIGNPCVTGTLADGTECEVLTEEDLAIATAKGWYIAY